MIYSGSKVRLSFVYFPGFLTLEHLCFPNFRDTVHISMKIESTLDKTSVLMDVACLAPEIV